MAVGSGGQTECRDQSVAGPRDEQHAQEEVQQSMEVTTQANDSHNDDTARESQQVQSQKDKKKRTRLCYHPKLEKSLKRISVTAVEFGLNSKEDLDLNELDKGKGEVRF